MPACCMKEVWPVVTFDMEHWEKLPSQLDWAMFDISFNIVSSDFSFLFIFIWQMKQEDQQDVYHSNLFTLLHQFFGKIKYLTVFSFKSAKWRYSWTGEISSCGLARISGKNLVSKLTKMEESLLKIFPY